MSAQIPVLLEQLTAHFMRSDPDAAISDAAMMSGYTVAALFSSLLAGIVGSKLVSELGAELRRRVFYSTQKMDVQDIHKFSIPELTKVMTSDVENVSGFYTSLFTSGLMLPLTVLILAPVMATKSIEIILMIGVIMLLTFALAYHTFRRVEPYIEQGGKDTVEINNKVIEYLEGMNIIRAYGGEEKHYSDFKELSDDISKVNRKLSHNLSYIGPMMDTMVIIIPLAIYAIAYLVMPGMDSDQQIDTLSGIISFTMYAMMLLAAVTQTSYVLSTTFPNYVSSRQSLEAVIDFEPSMKDGDKENPNTSGSLEFRNVSFAYPGHTEPFLKDISFKIEPGEKVAIIGPSASGKSTMLNLAQRFYDVSSGSILIDGMDVREYRFKDLRGRVAFYPQIPIIFSATAFSNVRFGPLSQEMPGQEIKKIMDECEVTGFLDDLPNGWGTVLTDNGVKLSGGQKQRICLARTLATPGEIYLLDTPFSAVDARMESRMMDAAWKRLSGRTVVLVTHKISAARRCDRIIVMENGEIVGMGTHQELMGSCEYYSSLMTLQSDWGSML